MHTLSASSLRLHLYTMTCLGTAAAAAAAGTTAWLKLGGLCKMMMPQMMQDWLALYKLDRKQLAALAANAQAAQAYEDYLHLTVQEVVEDLLAEFDEPEAEPAPGDWVKLAPAATVLVLSRFLHSCLLHHTLAITQRIV